MNEVNGLSVNEMNDPSVNEMNGLSVSITNCPSVNEVNGHSVNITNDPPKKTKPCTTIIIYKSGNKQWILLKRYIN